MGDRGGPGDKRAVDKDRHGENDVIKMGDAAVIRVVDGEDIPRGDAALIVFAQDRLHCLVKHADESGNSRPGRRDFAVGVGDASAEIENFIDDRAHRRLAHRREHLVGNGLERVLDDVEGDRVLDRLHGHLHCAFSIWMLP